MELHPGVAADSMRWRPTRSSGEVKEHCPLVTEQVEGSVPLLDRGSSIQAGQYL